jgi:putative aldouronate transport system permease protein
MAQITIQRDLRQNRFTSFGTAVRKDFRRNWFIYLMAVPVLGYYLLFHYQPMYGAVIAFKNFMPADGILGSKWVGMKHFITFFNSPYAFRLIRNTVLISFYSLVFGFPAPLLLALLLNEISFSPYKRVIQTLTYLPHFISLVVICSLIISFTASEGLINDMIAFFLGSEVRSTLLQDPANFRAVYVTSGIWQEVGWGSIIYLASMSRIDAELYEAAIIDGASRFKRALHVTMPGIMPTVTIMLILRMGSLMSVGFEKVFLLYNAGIYETADVISTYVYRRGIIDTDWSFSAAVGLFNSIVNFILVVSANYISKKVSETSLW